MPDWKKLAEMLSTTVAREAGYSFALALFVAILVLGYKPKLTGVKTLILGIVLFFSNIGLLVFIQEKEPALYFGTFFYIMIPVAWFAIERNRGDKARPRFTAIAVAVWMLLFREFGLVAHSYASALMMTLVLVPIFQCWRDPKEEGFPRTKLKDWSVAGSAICAFLTITVLMAACHWDGSMVSKYSHGLMAIPLPFFLLFFFFAKAIPEELVFRGIFQGALKEKLGFLPALSGSALLYGIAALNDPAWALPNWRSAMNTVLLGLGCGMVYNKTRSLAISASVNATVSFLWWFVFEHGGR